MTATVKTVQFVDPRIEPQPDPLYDYVIAPQQNQYYKIAASSKSNHSLNFNNLTTLGVDRAYLDTFEIELTCTFAFHLSYPNAADKAQYKTGQGAGEVTHNVVYTDPADIRRFLISNKCFTFDSFPFNKCCQNATVNINGGAFQSEPMMYIRAKEHYMKQDALVRSYANVCPCIRPIGQYESGRRYWMPLDNAKSDSIITMRREDSARSKSRFTANVISAQQSQSACDGIAYAGSNNSIMKLGKTFRFTDGQNPDIAAVDYSKLRLKDGDNDTVLLTVTWREPVFCSPFSSRYDADYGRPLYNITSMDLAFTMCDLGNMIRLVPPSDGIAGLLNEQLYCYGDRPGDAPGVQTLTRSGFGVYIDSYTVNIDSANLCYQVMTIPPVISKPLTTLVPYRRFVPYLTDVRNTLTRDGQFSVSRFGETANVYSGVYTLNEIPTAIWAFVAPSKAQIQNNQPAFQGLTMYNANNDGDVFSQLPAWDFNKQFAAVNNVSITMANTTQILSTASREDLYRICKANGCEDLFSDWDMGQTFVGFPYGYGTRDIAPTKLGLETDGYASSQIGTGSVLRFKPGVDLIVPDQPLIPAANANNMVLQFSGNFTIPPNAINHCEYALWLIFEYVGVAAISPGQCEISMNPLGSGEIMAVSPVMSSSSADSAGELEGSGFWGRLKNMFRNKDRVVDTLMTVVPKVRQGIDVAEGILNKLKRPRESDEGEGESGSSKRARGGAVIGRGLNDWTA